MTAIYTKHYNKPPINYTEIARYASLKKISPSTQEIINSCIDELQNKITYKVCYSEFPIKLISDSEYTINMNFSTIKSADLYKNLLKCNNIIVFAATIGIEIDRLIAKYSSISPSKALMLQAIGTERLESLCDIFSKDISHSKLQSNQYTHPRFSPGYGDLPIELQRDIFQTLDCYRKIGISLNKSLIMSPSKSVTAIIGIENKE